MNPDRLGVTAHCLRFEIAAGLESALERLGRSGLRGIEMMSFPGCRGQGWGDFGAATDRDPREIGAAIRGAGFQIPSAMALGPELEPPLLHTTLRWVKGLGCERLVQSNILVADGATRSDWLRAFERVEGIAHRVRDADLRFVLHTQPNLWNSVDDRRPIDELLERLDPELMRLEYDPTGAINIGSDPADCLRRRPDAFYAMHLRDGCTPPAPVFYLPALALGAGSVDWGATLEAATRTSIEWYFLEMEVTEPAQTLAAIEASRNFLIDRGFLTPGAAPHQTRA